jgi:hypothetical protein
MEVRAGLAEYSGVWGVGQSAAPQASEWMPDHPRHFECGDLQRKPVILLMLLTMSGATDSVECF